jgi:hypothetical protein
MLVSPIKSSSQGLVASSHKFTTDFKISIYWFRPRPPGGGLGYRIKKEDNPTVRFGFSARLLWRAGTYGLQLSKSTLPDFQLAQQLHPCPDELFSSKLSFSTIILVSAPYFSLSLFFFNSLIL